jgi:phosphatidylinositol glycan class B
MVLVGIGIDYWLYGKLTLSAWNYFYVNLVEDVASGYGTERWWNYFYSIFRFSFFPIGIPLILALIYFVYRQPRSIFTWTILPFFIIHSIIAHKELRFLFPVVNLVPVILVLAYQELRRKPGNWKSPVSISLRILGVIIIGINCIGTLTVSLKPADGGLMLITRHIRMNYGDQPLRLISYDHSNPYGPWGLMAGFYAEKDMLDIRLESLSDINDFLLQGDRINLLSVKRQEVEKPEFQRLLTRYNMQKRTQGLPEWMEILMTLYGGYRVNEILELYEIPPNPI